jgi:DNA-directed RNA polymerase II subunit RPB1
LKGKKGRARWNLLGKRVNNAARTVITGDDNIGPQEVGVPQAICDQLVVYRKVTVYNKHKLSSWIDSGIVKAVTADNQRIELKMRKVELEVGWTVERKLMKGDIVLMNRQPSLHKQSIMAHTVVPIPGKTFTLNTSVCSPYNADFDGDEMNLHVMSSIQAQAEATVLCAVSSQIMSSASNKNCIGLIQDSIVGLYLLSQEKEIPREAWCQMSPIIKCPAEYNAKTLISVCFPDDLFYKGTGGVLIVNGMLKSGILTKAHLGTAPNSIIHVLCMDYTDKIALNFIHMAQKLGHAYIAWRGFTMSVADMIPNQEYTKQCNQQMADAFQRASISDAVAVLNGARDSMSLVADTCIPAVNNFRICINSGVSYYLFYFFVCFIVNISLFSLDSE